jgi:hypothetical protein
MSSRFLFAFFAFGGLLGGCFTRFATPADVPAGRHTLLDNIDTYYLTKAKEQAAFTGHCPADEVKVQIVSTKPDTYQVVGSRLETAFIVEQGTQIATIGAEGCESRQVYQVICGPRQAYGSVAMPPFGDPCDVVSSGDANRLVQRNIEQQESIDRANAAAAAAAAAANKK